MLFYPYFFDDHYLLLAPGESRKIRCTYATKDAGSNAAPYILTTAWNVDVKNSSSLKEAGFEEELKSK
jgi:hypothetical protein